MAYKRMLRTFVQGFFLSTQNYVLVTLMCVYGLVNVSRQCTGTSRLVTTIVVCMNIL